MKDVPHLSKAVAVSLDTLRKNMGLTKAALADRAGFERCYLFDLLKGKTRPSVNAVFSLCEALRVGAAEFFRLVMVEIEKEKAKKLNISSFMPEFAPKGEAADLKIGAL